MAVIASSDQDEQTLQATKIHLERLSRLAIEAIVNSRDFEYQSNIGHEVAEIKAAGFVIDHRGLTLSNEELMSCCKDRIQAFPGYRIDVVNTFSAIDMDTGTATVFLNTHITENIDVVIKGCSSLDWRRIKSGRSYKWVCTRHTIMRGFAGGFDFVG